MDKQIAVFSDFQGISQKILIGIANHFQSMEGWSMTPFQLRASLMDQDFQEKNYHAAIVVDPDGIAADELKNLAIPVIAVFQESAGKKGSPAINVDHKEIGEIAAQHLLGRGFKNIAFVGGIETEVAKERYYSFKGHLDQKDVNLHLFSETFPKNSEQEKNTRTFRERLSTWLDALPKPIGIYALDDWKAFTTHLCCKKLGISIPEDVAIIGVNDDELACQISMPNLSSIRLPFEKIGVESAKTAVRLVLEGDAESMLIKPVGLVTRESTNTFAVNDKVVEEALKFMQQESNKPIRVEEVLKHVGVSRSLLERRFRGEIGRTPLVEMRRQRVERARGLLADTEYAINKISEMCGFASNIRFTTVFREQVGVTPSEFRSQMQSSN